MLAAPDCTSQPYLNALKTILRGELKDLLAEVTGIPLNDVVDLFCGKYARTDYLLCHDDELEGTVDYCCTLGGCPIAVDVR